jgi:hypothetical protein
MINNRESKHRIADESEAFISWFPHFNGIT